MIYWRAENVCVVVVPYINQTPACCGWIWAMIVKHVFPNEAQRLCKKAMITLSSFTSSFMTKIMRLHSYDILALGELESLVHAIETPHHSTKHHCGMEVREARGEIDRLSHVCLRF